MSTFNQKTLNSFVDVFVEQYDILTDKIKGFVGQGTVDMCPHITAAVADIVCGIFLYTIFLNLFDFYKFLFF